MLACGPTMSAAADIGLSKVIVQDELGNGVVSVIFRYLPSGEQLRVRKTDLSGTLLLDPAIMCDPGELIRAVPDSINRYFEPHAEEVGEAVNLIVRRRPAGSSEDGGTVPTKPEERLVYFTELAEGSRSDDRTHAADLEQRVYIAAGEVLHVEVPMFFDIVQGKFVASPQLEGATAAYQSENSLQVSGKLDFVTIDSLTDGRYGAINWKYLHGVESDTIGKARPDEPLLPMDFSDDVGNMGDSTIVMLAINAENSKAWERFGLGAMLFNELTVRLRFVGSETARQMAAATEVESYRMIGEALSVEDAVHYDPVQGDFVMSPALVDRLTRFQQESGVELTGKADYATLRSLAGGADVGLYLSGIRVSEP